MKFVWAVVFFCIIEYASAEKCECAAYFKGKNEKPIAQLPDSEIGSCADINKCAERCEQEFDQATGNGDVNHVTSKGTTVGQMACRNYGGDIQDGEPAAYWRACGGDWTYIRSANGKVCCEGGQEVQC